MLCVILLFCASVIQGQGAAVTNNPGEVTRFPLTQSITFLAHNNLEGQHFGEIEIGDIILYLDGDPETKGMYEVVEIVEAQASDPWSEYTNLLIDGEWMTPAQAYDRVGYTDPEKLVLQTCIEKDGNWSWGRLFVIAVEVSP
jgi:hypothetical protein